MTAQLVVVYEDALRTMKFMEQLSDAPFLKNIKIQMMDVGIPYGIISPPSRDLGQHVPTMVFSRCSGSYLSRDHTCSPSLIESIIFTAGLLPNCKVYNGHRAFRLEMNKMLANLYIQSSVFSIACRSREDGPRLCVPFTVAVTALTSKIVGRAVEKYALRGECYVKGLVGGGSISVHRLKLSSGLPLEPQLAQIREALKDTNNADDILILQAQAPSALPNVQYRFEVINRIVHYVVRIEQSGSDNDASMGGTTVANLCMCDIDVEDPGVSLEILKTPQQLAMEPGMANVPNAARNAQQLFTDIETFATLQELHVVALEGTLHDGKLWAFDVNTNSNYNSELEKASGVTPGAWKVVESMLV